MESAERDPLWKEFKEAQIIGLVRTKNPDLDGIDFELAIEDFKRRTSEFEQTTIEILRPLFDMILEAKVDSSLWMPVMSHLANTISALRVDFLDAIELLVRTCEVLGDIKNDDNVDDRDIESIEEMVSDILKKVRNYTEKWNLRGP